MATSPTLDIDSLVVPVSEEAPAGPELRSSQGEERDLYYAVRDARRKASVAERRVRAWALLTEDERREERAPDAPDWTTVRDLAVGALGKSKDVWIVAWLTESLTRLHGFAGLRDGYRLAHALCDTFWPTIYPTPEEGEDLRETFAQLAGLNGIDAEGTLILPIMTSPVTADTSVGQFSCADYKDASDLEAKDPDIRSQRIEQGAATVEQIERAISESSPEFLQGMTEDLEEAQQAFGAFNELLAAKAADTPEGTVWLPPSSAIEDALKECARLFGGLTRGVLATEETGETEEASMDVAGSTAPQRLAAAPVQTRDEAFRALLQVADYFRKAEPHSPVSYALEQVVRWGKMSLPELLAELVADNSARQEIFKRTGIKESDSD